MFNQWISRIVAEKPGSESQSVADVERVSAALLVEIARADHQLDDEEMESICDALKQSSSLPDAEIDTIVHTAITDADSTVSLHEHIRLVNEHFDRANKLMLIEQMWRVAAADGNIDRYEDYTIRKFSELIYVRHSEFIKAKLRVLES
ncbi:MAG: TerB family tellurite resistance protein [Gammaproteobacteria bacterium]|nr:TerB family tellurite resistance protein [Gammaproteobacteria bacterium]